MNQFLEAIKPYLLLSMFSRIHTLSYLYLFQQAVYLLYGAVSFSPNEFGLKSAMHTNAIKVWEVDERCEMQMRWQHVGVAHK